MKVLHICNDFCGSKVHSNLFGQLNKIGLEQVVYAYFRGADKTGKNQFEANNTKFVYSGILKPLHRVFYHQKVKTVYNDLLKHIKPDEINVCNATTLFSDGAIAYKLYKNYGIPYIVTVRKTDISEFLTFAPHTWRMGLKVLQNAQKIIFISKAPMDNFCKHFIIKRILPSIKSKFILQPNGIDSYWLDHINLDRQNYNHNILYVGQFDFNKNVVRLIEAISSLRDKYPDVCLHLVGGGGEREKTILDIVKKNPDYLKYHGKIFEKDKLKEIYGTCSIFAMPSIFETFGLVYIEALSQGLAVLYTKGQGIDGLLNPLVGEAVNAFSVKSIEQSLQKIIENRECYNKPEMVDFNQFSWERIAERYKEIYNSIVFEKVQ